MIYLVIPSIIFIPILSSTIPKNNSEFVKMSHAEVIDARPVFLPANPQPIQPIESPPPSGHIDHVDHQEDHVNSQKIVDLMQNQEDGNILFVPDQSGRRVEESGREDRRIDDILSNRRTLQELADGKRRTTEAPPDEEEENIVFVSGKNHDADDPSQDHNRVQHEDAKQDNIHIVETKKKSDAPKLDCKHLNCNNTIESICGGKVVNNDWKYRLFLNECYFRKVNCAFKSESSRYKVMSRSSCRGVGEHISPVPYNYMHYPPRSFYHAPEPPQEAAKIDTRRQFYTRRATTKDINGFLCSHACPTSCPDEYEPECAVSSTGNRKVFLNHCKLDYNSCSFGVVWHRRPLSECVGGKKADMRQNRGFIGWMQRVGLVDGKGRLTFD